MATLMEKQKNGLLKKFHTLLGRNGIDQEDKMAILSAYGVESSKDLSAHELLDVCNRLDGMANPRAGASDKARKRVIAAIASYCGAIYRPVDIDEIKRIACRAAGCERFNRIGLDRLNSLYNAFKKREKDLQAVDRFGASELAKMTNYN
jgi:hypothetical protein